MEHPFLPSKKILDALPDSARMVWGKASAKVDMVKAINSRYYYGKGKETQSLWRRKSARYAAWYAENREKKKEYLREYRKRKAKEARNANP